MRNQATPSGRTSHPTPRTQPILASAILTSSRRAPDTGNADILAAAGYAVFAYYQGVEVEALAESVSPDCACGNDCPLAPATEASSGPLDLTCLAVWTGLKTAADRVVKALLGDHVESPRADRDLLTAERYLRSTGAHAAADAYLDAICEQVDIFFANPRIADEVRFVAGQFDLDSEVSHALVYQFLDDLYDEATTQDPRSR